MISFKYGIDSFVNLSSASNQSIQFPVANLRCENGNSILFSWIIKTYIDLNVFLQLAIILFITITNASFLTYKICFNTKEKDTIKNIFGHFLFKKQ